MMVFCDILRYGKLQFFGFRQADYNFMGLGDRLNYEVYRGKTEIVMDQREKIEIAILQGAY